MGHSVRYYQLTQRHRWVHKLTRYVLYDYNYSKIRGNSRQKDTTVSKNIGVGGTEWLLLDLLPSVS